MSIQPAPATSSLGVRTTLGVLRFRRWTVLATTAAVLGPILAFSFLQKPVYSSQAEVLVKPFSLPSAGASPDQALNVETESKVAASLPVATLAAKTLGPSVGPPTALLSNLSVAADATTNIMTFSYTAGQPQSAQQGTQAFVNAYLDNRRQQMADDLLASSRAVQDQIGLLTNQLASLGKQIAATTDPSRKQSLQSQASLVVNQIALQQQNLGQLNPPDTIQLGQILQPATLPTSPASPKHVRDAALGAFVGLGLGFLAAILRDRLDDTVRDAEGIEARTGLPVLAVVPDPNLKRRGKARPSGQIVVAQLPGSPASIAYRKLRTVLLPPGMDTGPRTLMVTSPDNHEASSVAAANLAAALGLAGKLVVLVCADLRSCSVSTYFRKPGMEHLADVAGHVGMLPLRGVVHRIGLTDVLAGHADALDALAPTQIGNLELLMGGTACSNMTELLGSEAMSRLLKELQELSDVVVIHAAPVLEVADAVTLARAVDAVVLVAEAGSTTQGGIEQACRELRRVTARLAGVVLTNVDARRGTQGASA